MKINKLFEQLVGIKSFSVTNEQMCMFSESLVRVCHTVNRLLSLFIQKRKEELLT